MPTKKSINYWLKFLNMLFEKDEFKWHFDKNRTMLMSLNVKGFYKLPPSEEAIMEFFSKLSTDVKVKFLKKYQESSSYVPGPTETGMEIHGLLKDLSVEDQTRFLRDFFFNSVGKEGPDWLGKLVMYIEDGSLFGAVDVAERNAETGPPSLKSVEKVLKKGSAMSDSEHVVVAQYKTSIDSGVAFYRVIGQISPELKFVSKIEAAKLYPGAGEMVVSSKLASHPFKDDSLVSWVLGEPDPNHSTHYSAIRQGTEYRVYVVSAITSRLQEIDRVREAILDFYTRNPSRNQLFRTSDGAFIRPNFPTSPVGDINFNLPLDVFRKLKTHLTAEFGEVVWDFSDVKIEKVSFISAHSLLRRFLKMLDVKERIKKVGLTKDLISELTDDLEKFGSEGLDHKDLARVKHLLLNITGQSDAAEDVGKFILQSPDFKHRLDDYLENAKHTVELELAGVKGDIQRKLEEKEKIEGALANARQTHQKTIKELDSAVAKKFKEAVSKGKDVLVESALFQALLSNQSPPFENASPTVQQQILLPDPAISIKSVDDFSRQIEPFSESVGTEIGVCIAFLASLLGCRNLVVESDSPSRLSRAIASAFFGGVYLDISLPGDLFSASELLNLPSNLYGVEAGPVSFAAALNQLTYCQRPILISVRGINRAPEGIVLEEIRDWVSQSMGGGIEISFSNPRKVIEKVRIPKDIFILFFVDQGETTIPISRNVLANLPLFSISAPPMLETDTDCALLMKEVLDEVHTFIRGEMRRNRLLNKCPVGVRDRWSTNELIKSISSLAGIQLEESVRRDIFVSETFLTPAAEKLLKELELHGASHGSRTQGLFDLLSKEGGFK